MSDKDGPSKKTKKSKSEKNAAKAKKAKQAELAALEKAGGAGSPDGSDPAAEPSAAHSPEPAGRADESGRETGDGAEAATPVSDLLREIGTRLKSASDGRLAELGMNAQQGQMLGHIYRFREDGIIQNELAKHFNRTGASVSSMLQGLEKKGYVKRIVPEGNERQKKVYVTKKAKALIPEFDRMFVELEQRITAGLKPEETEALHALLEQVKSRL